MPKKGPTFLKVYIIPVLLLNLAVGSWGVIATYIAHGMLIHLGYAVIVTVGLYLYLLYLDRYLSWSRVLLRTARERGESGDQVSETSSLVSRQASRSRREEK